MDKQLKRALSLCVVPLAFLVIGVQPALAQSGGGGGALGDVIISAAKELLKLLFSPIRTVIERHGNDLLKTVVGTPSPEAVFNAPTNNAWPNIYNYYWKTIIPLSLTLYGLSIGMIIFLESTSHLFSGYHRSKLKKRAFAGLLGILAWWWIAALSLRFTDALAGFLVPSVSDITLFQTLSFSGMGVLGLVFTLSVDFILFVLIGLIYLVRQLALYLFVLLMPILIVFWIPGIGPFALVSKFMKKLAGFYVPFLFMTVPVALLFRLGDLLGTSADLSAGGIGAWLTALVIPLAAVLAPFILFWQAGAIFFMADRASHHVSAHRARERVGSGREGIQTTKQGSQNFVRGVRDAPAVTQSGQYVFDSGDSRSHAAGKRVNRAGSRLRNVYSDGGSGGERGGGGGGGGGGGTTRSDGGAGGSGDADRGTRNTSHDNMHDPTQPSENRDSTYVDEPPRYLQ